jgi:hypothetical protein
MKIRELNAIEKILENFDELKNYDLIIFRNINDENKYEGKFHVIITSESPALGVLKLMDKYLKEKLKAQCVIFNEPKLGSLGFYYNKYHDFFRCYQVNIKNRIVEYCSNCCSNRDSITLDIDYILYVENCFYGRGLHLNFDIFKNISKLNEMVLEEVKSLGLSKDEFKTYIRNFLVKGPFVEINGDKKIINDLVGYLKNSQLEKIRTYYEYPLTEEENLLLEKLDDKNYEYYQSLLKMFLIANELGWMDNLNIENVRKNIVDYMKKEVQRVKKV